MTRTKWSQAEPYNSLVKTKSKCNNAVVGCVPLAGAQLIAYWKYPTTLDNITFNWNSILSDATLTLSSNEADVNAISYLLKDIGESCDAKYHCGQSNCDKCDGVATGAFDEKLMDFLKKSGYTVSDGKAYDYSKVTNSLDNGRPIIISGYANKIKRKIFGIFSRTSYTNGHCWILDGYKVRKRDYRNETKTYVGASLVSTKTTYTSEYSRLLHCNWGWGGCDNGFFSSGVFDTAKAIELDDSSSGQSDNYQYKINLYYEIHPN